MTVTELFPPLVFLRLRILDWPEACHVWRRDGMTLLSCDPRASRIEITECSLDILSEAESAAVRAGFGWGARMPDWTTDDGLAYLYVPPPLRLTGAPPIQGGRELVRRRRAGQLDDEWAAYTNELRLTASRGA